jgi:hypothetical protein
MNHFNSIISNISWSIETLPSTARIINVENLDNINIPENILNYKLPYSHIASKIVLLTRNGEIILTTNFNGTTFNHWLNSLYEGLHLPINNDELTNKQRENIYILISRFTDSEYRKLLVNKLENSELKPVNLLGDYKYFEGGLKRNNNIWSYRVGS